MIVRICSSFLSIIFASSLYKNRMIWCFSYCLKNEQECNYQASKLEAKPRVFTPDNTLLLFFLNCFKISGILITHSCTHLIFRSGVVLV